MAERVPPQRRGVGFGTMCLASRIVEHLRYVAFHAIDHLAWSPVICGQIWQCTATAAAVTMTE
jgi:hypothetical protein